MEATTQNLTERPCATKNALPTTTYCTVRIDVLVDRHELLLRDDFAQMSMGRTVEIVVCRAVSIKLRLVVDILFFKVVVSRTYLSIVANHGKWLIMGNSNLLLCFLCDL